MAQICRILLLCIFFPCILFAQGTLTPTGIHTWAFDTNPGAGSLTVDNDSLNGNWIKLNTFLGFDHTTNGYHMDIDHYGIFRFLDDSASKIRWRNDDTILTKSTGQHNLITQVRDDGTHAAANSISLLLRSNDDDSTYAGITASGDSKMRLFGDVTIDDSISIQYDGTASEHGVLSFKDIGNTEHWRFRHETATGTFILSNTNDTTMQFVESATASARGIKIDTDNYLQAGRPVRNSSTFSTTATRAAIYIAGAASTDVYVVSPNAVDAFTLPVAGDLCNGFAKTDSLVVQRAVGTTSNLGFSYIRIK